MEISKKMQEQLSGSSAIRRLFEEGRQMAALYGEEAVYDFSLGNPYPPTPPQVAEIIRRLLDHQDSRALHGYMSNAGYPYVREAVAASLKQRFGIPYSREHILMTVGAAGGLNLLCAVLLDPGDEVVCFAPYFGEYRNYVHHQGAKLTVVPADLEHLALNVDGLAACVNKHTKMILINNPNNPSGVVYPKESYQALSEEVKRLEALIGHELVVVFDEPYRELVYDGVELPCGAHYFANSISCYSFSKSLSLPGERIGYLALCPSLRQADEMMNALTVANRTMGFVNAPSLFQQVVVDCLDLGVDTSFYDANRQLLYEQLSGLGFSCIKPQGAFYLLIRSPLADGAAFVRAAKRHHILLVDTADFGAPGYVRLAYCVSHETVQRSLPAFAALAVEVFGPN